MKKLLLIPLFICSTLTASAQFYYTGRGATRTKWSQINKDKYRLIFPEEYDMGATRYAMILDSIYPHINYKFCKPIQKTPIILRTENLRSNGYVVWAPKREEIVTNISGNTYAMPWAKQVAIHEARHVAQISILKTGITKVASWLLGEAGVSVGLLVISKWQLEGDATLAETQFSEYGRGLQPEFTLGYRGLAAGGKLNFKRLDPWVAGSYKQYIPDIYQFGYQMCTAAETYFSPTFWNDIATYSARYPIFISPRWFYLRKHYKSSFSKLAKRTFAELDSIWRPTYSIDNSFDILTATPKLHTNYTSALPYKDRFIATKWDMKLPTAFVSIDTATMHEKRLHTVGNITSTPLVSGDKLYWTEYKAHPIFEQINFSVVRSMDLITGRRKVYNRRGIDYFVTPLPDGRFATITNDDQSNSYIRISDSTFKPELESFKFKEPTTLHGLTYDGGKLYYIGLDERGMWIGAVDSDGVMAEITAPSVVSIQDLRAANGKLHFSSIQSGKNEIHTIDIATGKEYRQTTSKLASVAPVAIDSSTILFTAYTSRGWAVARTKISDSIPVEWSRLPNNTLNAKRYKWDVPTNFKIPTDTLKTADKPKRFRRALRAFNVHSWAPIPFSGNMSLSEKGSIPLAFGASVFFQSTLSEMQGFASYGWINNMSWLKSNITYTGLPVQIQVDAEYGGGKQLTYYPSGYEGTYSADLKPYLGVGVTLSMPLNLSSGARSRYLQPTFKVEHYNSRLFKNEKDGFGSSIQTYQGALAWSDIQTKGYRSLYPRYGYSLRLSNTGAFTKDFSTIVALVAKAYLPGFGATHSLLLGGGYQHQFDYNEYKLTNKLLVPRGLVDETPAKDYLAFQTTYAMPLAYPEWGLDGFLYFRRISAEAFFDYSFGRYYNRSPQEWNNSNYSAGVIVAVDTNIFSTLQTQLSFTFANTSEQNFWFGLGISFNL